MPFREVYRQQVALLIRTLPLVAQEKVFALKGGTAINLFVRNMPRLSVDIDLTYLPVEPRDASLTAIDAAMKRIADRAKKTFENPHVAEGRIQPESIVNRLNIRVAGVQTKIEVTPVLRGCVSDPSVRDVAKAVEDEFGFAQIQTVSFDDLYAGKIVAALDRQHPRDLFDYRDLRANEGINDNLRRAFIVYLLSHDRPMWEVLQCNPKNIEDEFARGFEGMTEKPVSLNALYEAREQLKKDIVGGMPQDHRRFLISFEEGKPEWSLLGVKAAAGLPAVKWRQRNLDKLDAQRRADLVAGLKRVLAL
jgi:predicted nucleotidyltransferase component of viral defense system